MTKKKIRGNREGLYMCESIHCACQQSIFGVNDFDHVQSFYKIAILNVSCTLFKKKEMFI